MTSGWVWLGVGAWLVMTFVAIQFGKAAAKYRPKPPGMEREDREWPR